MAFHSKSAKQKSKISQEKILKYLKMNLIIKVCMGALLARMSVHVVFSEARRTHTHK